MIDLKRIGKVLLCLALCLVCLTTANPVSAMSTLSVPNSNTAVLPELPVFPVEAPEAENKGHLVSYVRLSANSSSTIIGCLEDGTTVTVLETKKKFYKIDCYDMVGYIAKSQVAVNDAGEYVVQAVADSTESTYLPSFSAQEALEMRSELVALAKKYIGVPYVYGGVTTRGFDCSGYTQYVYRKLGITLNRTAASQASNGIIVAREDMQPGDLVIFSNTVGHRFGTHIGLYLGNGKIIHAGSSRGVCIADLDSNYFDSHFECARRVILTDTSPAATVPSIGSITGGIGSSWRTEG